MPFCEECGDYVSNDAAAPRWGGWLCVSCDAIRTREFTSKGSLNRTNYPRRAHNHVLPEDRQQKAKRKAQRSKVKTYLPQSWWDEFYEKHPEKKKENNQ